jgi:hypothetical protein
VNEQSNNNGQSNEVLDTNVNNQTEGTDVSTGTGAPPANAESLKRVHPIYLKVRVTNVTKPQMKDSEFTLNQHQKASVEVIRVFEQECIKDEKGAWKISDKPATSAPPKNEVRLIGVYTIHDDGKLYNQKELEIGDEIYAVWNTYEKNGKLTVNDKEAVTLIEYVPNTDKDADNGVSEMLSGLGITSVVVESHRNFGENQNSSARDYYASKSDKELAKMSSRREMAMRNLR